MIFQFLKASYRKLSDILSRAGARLGSQVRSLFGGGLKEETLEQLEKLLYESDLGVQISQQLTEKVRDLYRQNPKLNVDGLIEGMRKELFAMLPPQTPQLMSLPTGEGPLVILVVGVNGNGKTTSVAKLAKRFHDSGKRFLSQQPIPFAPLPSHSWSCGLKRLADPPCQRHSRKRSSSSDVRRCHGGQGPGG